MLCFGVPGSMSGENNLISAPMSLSLPPSLSLYLLFLFRLVSLLVFALHLFPRFLCLSPPPSHHLFSPILSFIFLHPFHHSIICASVCIISSLPFLCNVSLSLSLSLSFSHLSLADSFTLPLPPHLTLFTPSFILSVSPSLIICLPLTHSLSSPHLSLSLSLPPSSLLLLTLSQPLFCSFTPSVCLSALLSHLYIPYASAYLSAFPSSSLS